MNDVTSPSVNQPPMDCVDKGRMGDAFIKANKLRPTEVEAIVRLQNELNIRFGEAAIKLGLLTENDVRDVLDIQFDYASFATNGSASRIDPSLAIVHAPGSESAEAIKRLRSELLGRVEQGGSIRLAVLSPSKHEGKSYVAASLAIAFAQLNIKTMLIDANLREPVQHQLFGLPNQTGLSTILANRSSNVLDAIPEVIPNFWAIGSGPLPPNPLEILSGSKLKLLLDHFAPRVTVFIVDTPPTMQWADAQVIAMQTGLAIFVAREGVTKLAYLKKSKAEMDDIGINVLGVVYNRPSKYTAPKNNLFQVTNSNPFSWVWRRLARTRKAQE